MGETFIETEKRPPGKNGFAKPTPYDGGFEEIQIDAPVAPDSSMPPPQGEGSIPALTTVQSAT